MDKKSAAQDSQAKQDKTSSVKEINEVKEVKEAEESTKDICCAPVVQAQTGGTKCCYLTWAIIALQVITLILVGSLAKLNHQMLHKVHRFSECRPPIHRFYDDSNRIHKHDSEEEEHMMEMHHGEDEIEDEGIANH